jgi:hypothetical protein
MNDEQFSKIKKLIEDKLKINDEAVIVQTSKNMPAIFQTVLDLFIKEMCVLKELKRLKEKEYAELYKKFRENYNLTLTKDEIKTYCNSDEDYYKTCSEFDKQELYVKYFEMTLDNIKRMSYDIKNWVEIKKFYAGC